MGASRLRIPGRNDQGVERENPVALRHHHERINVDLVDGVPLRPGEVRKARQDFSESANIGSPRTAHQLAAVVGAHPAVKETDAKIQAGRFDARAWAPIIANLLDLPKFWRQ